MTQTRARVLAVVAAAVLAFGVAAAALAGGSPTQAEGVPLLPPNVLFLPPQP